VGGAKVIRSGLDGQGSAQWRSSVKWVGVAAFAMLAVLLIGDGYLRTRRVSEHAGMVKTAVSAMSIQELARRVQECDEGVKHDAAYCAEVIRRIEAQPLQIVEMPAPVPGAK